MRRAFEALLDGLRARVAGERRLPPGIRDDGHSEGFHPDAYMQSDDDDDFEEHLEVSGELADELPRWRRR